MLLNKNKIFLRLVIITLFVVPVQQYAMFKKVSARTAGYAVGMATGVISATSFYVAVAVKVLSSDYSQYSVEELQKQQTQLKNKSNRFLNKRYNEIQKLTYGQISVMPLVGCAGALMCPGFMTSLAVGTLTGAVYFKYMADGSMHGKNWLHHMCMPAVSIVHIKKELEKREKSL
ncbi:MAG: hypothetical protein WC707_06685 [Candidatus Babeliaceae bacterium]|jgi:hypothetical protein